MGLAGGQVRRQVETEQSVTKRVISETYIVSFVFPVDSCATEESVVALHIQSIREIWGEWLGRNGVAIHHQTQIIQIKMLEIEPIQCEVTVKSLIIDKPYDDSLCN